MTEASTTRKGMDASPAEAASAAGGFSDAAMGGDCGGLGSYRRLLMEARTAEGRGREWSLSELVEEKNRIERGRGVSLEE
jgi:hypothetical protein